MGDFHSDFLQRLMAVQQSLFAYIRSAGFSTTDSEDILQDAATALWESFASYDSSRPFVAWALGVTRNLIHKQRRYDRVRGNTAVDSRIIEKTSGYVAATLSSCEKGLSEERERMEECLESLPDSSKSLLRMRYRHRLSLKAIARKIARSYAATNMLLTRIRAKLLDCVSGGLEGSQP